MVNIAVFPTFAFQHCSMLPLVAISFLSQKCSISWLAVARGEYRSFLRLVTTFGGTKISVQILIHQLKINIDTV